MSYMNKVSMLDEMLNEVPHDVTSATFDFDESEPGMILQRRERDYVWRDYLVDGAAVKSPIDTDKLPPGEYRLVG